MEKAKIFWSGRSQAVRLPKAFRFEGKEVTIRREGETVILEPVRAGEDQWAWLERMPGENLDPSFVAAVESLRDEQAPELDPDVEKFFK